MNMKRVSDKALDQIIAHWQDEWERQREAALATRTVSTYDDIVVDTLAALVELRWWREQVKENEPPAPRFAVGNTVVNKPDRWSGIVIKVNFGILGSGWSYFVELSDGNTWHVVESELNLVDAQG